MHTEYSGSTLVDDRGNRVGQVSDVIYDESQDTPTWLVVKAGLFRGEHYVPAAGARRTGDHAIIVPFSADVIRSAPKAGGDHVLNSELRSRLVDHYGRQQ